MEAKYRCATFALEDGGGLEQAAPPAFTLGAGELRNLDESVALVGDQLERSRGIADRLAHHDLPAAQIVHPPVLFNAGRQHR